MMKRAPDFQVVGTFDNEKRLRVLGVLDKIRELGVSEDVSLPQVCI